MTAVAPSAPPRTLRRPARTSPPRKAAMTTSTPPHVVGGDISLTASGLAWTDHRTATFGRQGITAIRSIAARTETMDRLTIELAALIVGNASTGDGYPALVVLEDLTQRGGAAGISTEKAHVWWALVRTLHANRVPVMAVPVKTAKLYACGRGDANKREVVDGIREWFPEWEIKRTGARGTLLATDDDNKADAVTLMAIGCELLGEPLVELPARQRKALDKLELPPEVRRA